jgi:hypothetical protein
MCHGDWQNGGPPGKNPVATRTPPCMSWDRPMGFTGTKTMSVQRAWGPRAALVIARVLFLFMALQVPGVGPLLWGDCCSTDDDDCSGQTDRMPCNDCLPGCPKCHCAQVPFSVPPAVETERLDPSPRAPRVVWTPYEADVPREAPPSSIFRPPKLA